MVQRKSKPNTKKPRASRKPSKGLSESRKTTKLAPKKSTKVSRKRLPADPNDPREKALELMKKGASQREAAKAVGITGQRLARYRRQNTSGKWTGRKWVIRDTRPAVMLIASKGKLLPATVPYRAKGQVGRFWNAVNKFLDTNDRLHLKPYVGGGIRDTEGKYHPWETDPNLLHKLHGRGDLSFPEIYADVAR